MLKASHVWRKNVYSWEVTEETRQGDVLPFISLQLCCFEKVLPHRLLCQMMTMQSVSSTWVENIGRDCTIQTLLMHCLQKRILSEKAWCSPFLGVYFTF